MKDIIEYKVKVHPGGNKFWYLGGERHREDGPACEWADGYNKMAHRQATYINYARSDLQTNGGVK